MAVIGLTKMNLGCWSYKMTLNNFPVSRIYLLEYWKKKGLCEFGYIKTTRKDLKIKCQYNNKDCNFTTFKKKVGFIMLGKTNETKTFFFCPIHYLTQILEDIAISPLDRLELIKAGIYKEKK